MADEVSPARFSVRAVDSSVHLPLWLALQKAQQWVLVHEMITDHDDRHIPILVVNIGEELGDQPSVAAENIRKGNGSLLPARTIEHAARSVIVDGENCQIERLSRRRQGVEFILRALQKPVIGQSPFADVAFTFGNPRRSIRSPSGLLIDLLGI